MGKIEEKIERNRKDKEKRKDERDWIKRNKKDFMVIGDGNIDEGLGIFMRKEIVKWMKIEIGEGLRKNGGGFWIGLGKELKRIRIEIGRLKIELGLEYMRLIMELGEKDMRVEVKIGLKKMREFVEIGINMKRNGGEDIWGRVDIIDLKEGYIDEKWMRRLIKKEKKEVIDGIEVWKKIVKVNRKNEGEDIGNGEIKDRILKIRKMIGGMWRVK